MSASLAIVGATDTMLAEMGQKSSVPHRSQQELILNSGSCGLMIPLRAPFDLLVPESEAATKTFKDSCPATPSTRASSSLSSCDSPASSQTPEGQDVAAVGRARQESKPLERQSLLAQMANFPHQAKADAVNTQSDPKMNELFSLRDQLARFRNDADISAEAVKQTLFVIEELSKKDMTVKILRETGLGLECSKKFLAQHSSKEVSQSSRKLIARWKALAKTEPPRQPSTVKSSCASGVANSKQQTKPEIIGPEYLAMSEPDWEPKVEPECADQMKDQMKDQLKQKDAQIARLQASIKRRKSSVAKDDNIESENPIIKHYEEVLDSLQKEAEELRHQVGEA